MVYTDGMYVIANSERELGQFVKTLELPPEFLNSTSYYPHYWIPATHQKAVLEADVKIVSNQELLHLAARFHN